LLTEAEAGQGIYNTRMLVEYKHNVYFKPEFAPPTIIFKTSKQNMKHMKGLRHINDFFVRKEGNTITMATLLIRWNTARLMQEQLKKYDSIKLDTLEQLPTVQTKLEMCRKYIKANYTEAANPTLMRDELVTYMDRLSVLQRYVEDNPEDVETIASMIKELTGMNADTVLAVESPHLRAAEEVAQYLEDVKLFRWIHVPKDAQDVATMQSDIANFISVKGLRDL
jgi:hypothetical protein